MSDPNPGGGANAVRSTCRKALWLLALGLWCHGSFARETEGSRENSILLNGTWEFAVGEGSEGAQSAEGQRNVSWRKVHLPGPFMRWSQEAADTTKFVWARRDFRVSPAQAEGMAILRWNRIAAGAEAFINGRKVGENEPTGPFQAIVPAGVITAGDNQIVLNEGHFQPAIPGWFKEAGERTTTVTEYMNDFGHPRTQWTGVDDRAANDLAVAQIGAEHTEAMRRARVDGIWPYMYAGWTRTRLAARVRETGKGSAVWKTGYAAPQSAAWHSSLSPVLASLDLFDADYRTGQEVTTDLHLINDSWHDAAIHVDLLLTRECPEWIPEAACFDRPVLKWSFDFAEPADSKRKIPVTWKLPEEEGCYWLTARMTGLEGCPVLSQRFVRAIAPPVVSDEMRRCTFVVLGTSEEARSFFKAKGLRTSDHLERTSPDSQVVVIWSATHLTAAEKSGARAFCDFADRGGRVIVLAARSWEWSELCDVKISHEPRFSRVFPHGDLEYSPLGGLDRQWLVRWNGFPGTVAFGKLEGPAMERAEKILWAKEPKMTVMAAVPAATGRGRILFSQLDLQGRLDPSRPGYDPVAERILLKLLERPRN